MRMSHPLEDEHYYQEDDKKPTQMRKEDDQRLCIGQALMLLEHLDPYVFAVQASATGIVLYPRQQVQKLTTWEQTLLQTELPIPAEWIGGLAHIDQVTNPNYKKSLAITRTQQSSWKGKQASERAQVVAFSLNQFNQMLRECSSVGATSGTKSTQDACQSISKARSGGRRWKRSARPSSKTP